MTVALISALPSAHAQNEKVLHNFPLNDTKDGTEPYGALVFDASGNLYGTTATGGAFNSGTAYELTPESSGGWNEKVLHSFGSGVDGALPQSNLIVDSLGNLYGTTGEGGAYGFGTAFELSPKAGGGWMEKVLHSFGRVNDGQIPSGGLIFDAAGNLYGATQGGGINHDGGIVFELSPNAGGGWTELAVHNFGRTKDGVQPVGSLTFDVAGNLYGAACFGGAFGKGMAFELSPNTTGGWKETLLYSFEGAPDSYMVTGSLIFDSAGNLYGISSQGGVDDVGTVFELSPAAGGTWTSSILRSFQSNQGGGSFGYSPQGNLLLDSFGNLYGTTAIGGSDSVGVVYELTFEDNQYWEEIKFLSFGGSDGISPYAGLIADSAGYFYGTTYSCGEHGGGTVFRTTP